MIISVGDYIRLENWQHCAMHVLDIGRWNYFGSLIDIKTNEVVQNLFSDSKKKDWIKALTADEILKQI